MFKKEGRLCVKVGDIEKHSVRFSELSQCVLLGNVGISTPAVRSLLKEGVDVVFLSQRGRFLGRLSSGLSKNGIIRMHQYKFLSDEKAALELSKRCVNGKIENQRRLLKRYQKRRPSPDLAKAAVQLRHAIQEVQSASTADTLRGMEGHAASIYFSCWKDLLISDDIVFTKRIRRPPPDPVNILLSFGYTVLGNLIHSMVDASGLDPYLGALHTPRYGRPSLVLDLIEEFRPVVVDASVIRAINTKIVTLDDFEEVKIKKEEEIVYPREEYDRNQEQEEPKPVQEITFKRSGIRKWIAQLERRLDESSFFEPRGQTMTLRDIIRAQVYILADHIAEKSNYKPYLSPE